MNFFEQDNIRPADDRYYDTLIQYEPDFQSTGDRELDEIIQLSINTYEIENNNRKRHQQLNDNYDLVVSSMLNDIAERERMNKKNHEDYLLEISNRLNEKNEREKMNREHKLKDFNAFLSQFRFKYFEQCNIAINNYCNLISHYIELDGYIYDETLILIQQYHSRKKTSKFSDILILLINKDNIPKYDEEEYDNEEEGYDDEYHYPSDEE